MCQVDCSHIFCLLLSKTGVPVGYQSKHEPLGGRQCEALLVWVDY